MSFIYMNCVKNFINNKINNNNNKKIFPIIPNNIHNTPKKPTCIKFFSSHTSKYKINPKFKFIKKRSRLAISRNTNLTINTSIAQYKS